MSETPDNPAYREDLTRSRPRLLDLFCGAGGAAMGYHRAGFDVVGVDINPQPHYPFPFIQADAMQISWRGFDAIHASPPCQSYSTMRHLPGVGAPMLIPEVRSRLQVAGVPYVIENVEGAKRALEAPVMLCGTMFGIRVRRHRLFEIRPTPTYLLPFCTCGLGVVEGRLVAHRTSGQLSPGRRGPGIRADGALVKAANGVEWMTEKEARQAIPPAYTEWIGRQLTEAL